MQLPHKGNYMTKNIRPRKRNQEFFAPSPQPKRELSTLYKERHNFQCLAELKILATLVEFQIFNRNPSTAGHAFWAHKCGCSLRTIDKPFYRMVKDDMIVRDYRHMDTNRYRANEHFLNADDLHYLVEFMKRPPLKVWTAFKKLFAMGLLVFNFNVDYCMQEKTTLPNISSQFGAGFNPWMNLELFVYLQTPEADPFGPEPPWYITDRKLSHAELDYILANE